MNRFHNSPEPGRERFTLSKFSGYATAAAWFLLFSVLFTDEVFSMGEAGSDVSLYLCIGPIFILAILGFIIGLVTGLIAKKRVSEGTEEDKDFNQGGIRYSLIGLAFIILAPLINKIIAPIGIELYDITSLFGH
ncbi:MAG: hypothetical protein H0S79_17310 [Anaerolineaceae bacterium]|nr:hypothetical protein [Anaerolineaceae bacterium]